MSIAGATPPSPQGKKTVRVYRTSDLPTLIKGIIEVIHFALGLKDKKIEPQHMLTKDLGADSLDLADLIMEISEGCAIDIPQGDISADATVSDLIQATYNLITGETVTDQEILRIYKSITPDPEPTP